MVLKDAALVLWFISIGVAIHLVLVVMLLFSHHRRRRRRQAGLDGPSSTEAVDGSDLTLEQLEIMAPEKIYREENLESDGACQEEDEEDNCCVICFEDMQGGEMFRTLPCQHTFHATCITLWALKENRCPLCMAKVYVPPEPSPGQDDVVVDIPEQNEGSSSPPLDTPNHLLRRDRRFRALLHNLSPAPPSARGVTVSNA